MDSRKRIGILGGSFNPVHIGHIMLASYLAQFTGLDEVWLMLSPANPLKTSSEMASDSERLSMLKSACSDYPYIYPCDIELSLPRPSYTINSLDRLAELHPDMDFRLIIGSDNWLIFDRWRNAQKIIERFKPIIYPRPQFDVETSSLPSGVTLVNAPQIEISSTFIRQGISNGHDMAAFLHPKVYEHIKLSGLYITHIS